MSAETNHETNTALTRTVKRGEFDGGKHFCLQEHEIKVGEHYTERRRISSHEREILGDNSSISEEDTIFAKDTAVVITRKDGNKVHVADLFEIDGGELVRGDEKGHALTLTSEGWIVPQGLTVEEMYDLSAGNSAPIEGYYMPYVDPQAEELEEAEVPAFIRDAKQQRVGRAALGDAEQPPVYYGREY